MDIRNPQFAADGQAVDCEINHPAHGWIPFTATEGDDDTFGQEVWAALRELDIAPRAIASHATQAAGAMARLNDVHAAFLRDLTGNATIEERGTWNTKEEAARALLAGEASDGQIAMIGFEAAGAGVEPILLAQTVIARAEAFQSLIGKAAGLRARARAAIARATDEAVPLEQVEPALAAILEQLSAEADTAVTRIEADANDLAG